MIERGMSRHRLHRLHRLLIYENIPLVEHYNFKNLVFKLAI
jgi:hypothetical protein